MGEPLAGSAPQARMWVLLEQPGPWGRDAVLDSHLSREVGRELTDWAAPHPVRLGLIRRPGKHADKHTQPRRRTVLIARSDPGTTWIRTESVEDPRALLDLDLEQLLLTSDGPHGASDRALLVCTNSKRDRCCALLGRPLAEELSARWHERVWETSHLGGHRFAPTVVSLPDGYLYGGADAGTLSTKACRGRSTLEPAGQAAELAVLRHLNVQEPHPLVTVQDATDRWQVHSNGGASHTVEVVREEASVERAESCVKLKVPWQRMLATLVEEQEKSWH